jgi:quinol monooxygenase YgiN
MPKPTLRLCEHFLGNQGNSLEHAKRASSAEGAGVADDLEPVMVTMSFRTDRPDELMTVLSKYVVVSRGQAGCRNIDFVASATNPGRFLLVEKWDSAADQRTHFDSDEMVQMAQSCDGLLTEPPDIDLFDGVSMHDTA